MTYGSVCSGIEMASVAWRPFGWKAQFYAEIEKFCCAVLQHYYPEVENHGDFTRIGSDAGPIDVLVAGTPCQSFSVAGLRAGLDDTRGVLAFEFLKLAGRLRPRWIVFENVPGLLSSSKGRDFSAFIEALAQLGYGACWASLDARYFGVAQRRERVFLVANAGDWRRAAAVLFDTESLSGHSSPGREASEDVAGSLGVGSGKRGWCDDTDRATFVSETVRSHPRPGSNSLGNVALALNAKGGCGRIDGESETFVACPLTSNPYGDHESRDALLVTHALTADGFDAREDGTGRGVPLVPWLRQGLRIQDPNGVADTLSSNPKGGTQINPVLAFDTTQITSRTNRSNPQPGDPSHPLTHGGHQPTVAFTERTRSDGRSLETQEELAYALGNPASGGATHSRRIMHQMMVRRLTVRETERLMGLPDDYTLIPNYRKKQKERGADAEALLEYYHRTERGMQHVEMVNGRVLATPDGPRYRAIGNGFVVPVLRWIGRRIEMVDQL